MSKMSMSKRPLPFLGTHVANVALNKQIGLIFLQSPPQKTCGLTQISEESLRNDQLQVGGWMLRSFLGSYPEDPKLGVGEPWHRFEPFSIEAAADFPILDPQEIARYRGMVDTIDRERKALGERLWDTDHQPAVEFLKKLLAQIDECVTYTNRRIETVQLCGRISVAENAKEMEQIMASSSLEIEVGIARGFGAIVGGGPLMGALGYLTVKNIYTGPMIFAAELVEVIRRVLTPKAKEEGYTALAA